MKKLTLGLAALLALTLLSVTGATAHGNCSTFSFDPYRQGSTVRFTGVMACSDSHAAWVQMHIRQDRRTPGGAWTTINLWNSGNQAPARDVPQHTTTATFDCHKDYRTYTFGVAQNTLGGAGHNPFHYSNILYHTC